MFDRLAPRAHGVGICIEPALHSLEYMLMLPARDPAQRLTRRANPLHRPKTLALCLSWDAFWPEAAAPSKSVRAFVSSFA
jgi:hypothetical protein